MTGATIIVTGVVTGVALAAIGCWTFRFWPFGTDVVHVPTSEERYAEDVDATPYLIAKGTGGELWSEDLEDAPYDWKRDGL